MLITSIVLRLSIFNSINDTHPQNILFISVTWLLLKLLRFNFFNDSHL